MTVQELNSQHRRYIELSDRFRAAWAFHQFVASLNKVLLHAGEPRYPVDFQEVYSSLRELSSQLTATHTREVKERLDEIEHQLQLLTEVLTAEDSKVSPASLRQFFARVKNTNIKVLGQLAKFYLYSFRETEWSPDRVDKMDFLLSRIAADTGGTGPADIGSDHQSLLELIQGLWGMLGGEAGSEVAPGKCQEIQQIRGKIEQVKSLDELNDSQLIARYREIKHGLGKLFFHPDVAAAIVETNRQLRETIRRLYEGEENRIHSEFQRVLDLERQVPADYELGIEVAEFRNEIDHFESQLRREELSLTDLRRLRERTRSLLGKLDGRGGGTTVGADLEALDAGGSASPVLGRETTEADSLLAPYFRRVSEALEGSDRSESARAVVLRPDVFPLRLEPREVVAFRRLADGIAENPARERFLLESAALRVCLNEQVSEIRSLWDESATTGDAPVVQQGLRVARLATSFVHRFDNYLDQAVLEGEASEAQMLQWLRMRLLRDYSGHWLLVHKPLLRKR